MPQPRLPLMKLKGSLVYAFAASPPAPEPRRPGFLLIDGEKSSFHALRGFECNGLFASMIGKLEGARRKLAPVKFSQGWTNFVWASITAIIIAAPLFWIEGGCGWLQTKVFPPTRPRFMPLNSVWIDAPPLPISWHRGWWFGCGLSSSRDFATFQVVSLFDVLHRQFVWRDEHKVEDDISSPETADV
jgi:hypothetical protein